MSSKAMPQEEVGSTWKSQNRISRRIVSRDDPTEQAPNLPQHIELLNIEIGKGQVPGVTSEIIFDEERANVVDYGDVSQIIDFIKYIQEQQQMRY